MKKFMSMVTVMLAIVTSASSANAQQVMPAAKPQKFEGRDGVRALLAAVRDEEISPSGATLNAKPIERFQGGLDALEDVGASSPSGAAAALSMSVAAITRIDGDLQEAAASTIATTYESWVVTAAGCEEITVPEWTEIVMTRTGRGRDEAAAEAIEMQIDAEQRIDRLRNPGWGSAIAWWWSR